MFESSPKLPARSEVGVIAFYLGMLAAIVVAVITDGLIRIVALVVLALFGVYLLLGDFFLALSDERATVKYPHASRNSDVGRKVKVLDGFVAYARTSTGKVLLSGETWKARSTDGVLYEPGTELVVLKVEGLVLVVARPDDMTVPGGRG